MWGGYGMNYGWWAMGLFMVVAMTALIVVGVWLLARKRDVGVPTASAGYGTPGINPAKAILDARYAGGELTTEEYREKLTTLGL